MLCDEDDWQHLRLSHAKLLSSLFYGTLFAYYLCFLNDVLVYVKNWLQIQQKILLRVPISHPSNVFENYGEMYENMILCMHNTYIKIVLIHDICFFLNVFHFVDIYIYI